MKAEDFTKPEPIEYEGEENEGNTWLDILGISFISLTLLVALWAVDIFALNSFITMNLFIKSDCNYEVPKGYEILTDGKYFIVKCSKDQYLSVGYDMIEPIFPDITRPTKLVSECKAKGYLKRYLKNKNLVKDFKPIQTEK